MSDEPEDGDVIEPEGKAKGGFARAEVLPPERRTEIAKKAAEARWGKDMATATHEGLIRLGDVEIEVAVLNDGERVITQSGFMRALGRARQAKGRQHYKGDVNLPAFLTAQNLKPFISKELEVTSSQLEIKLLSGQRAYAYSADLLPDVCDVFIRAERAEVLKDSQQHIADRVHIIMKGLAHVGIAGLIDEATGYQEVRDRHALQAILDKFLRKEFAAWAQRFPEEFYRQIFRLKGWEWRGMKVNRPQVVAHYTKNIVYERLAPGILAELEARNPSDEKGNRRAKHHQWLTEDVGHPALAQHLHAVMGLMRASKSWDGFKALLDSAFPKQGENLKFDFMSDTP